MRVSNTPMQLDSSDSRSPQPSPGEVGYIRLRQLEMSNSGKPELDGRGSAPSMTSRTATLIGLTAILMWSLLAVLTVATGKIPAFQLAAMTFAIGALVGFLTWIGRPDASLSLRQSP